MSAARENVDGIAYRACSAYPTCPHAEGTASGPPPVALLWVAERVAGAPQLVATRSQPQLLRLLRLLRLPLFDGPL